MNYSNLELHHKYQILAELESNLIDEGYHIHCNIEDVKFDEYNRPYEQTQYGKVMLSNSKWRINKH
jgi:hypothetical protein